MEIIETRKTAVTEQCDVLVCGGGFAGISAALAAARQGRRVTLLEREYLLGGLGTAGLVTIFLPLCDGMGQQVSFGIAEELLRLSVSMGHEGRMPAAWLAGDRAHCGSADPRFEASFNPQLFAMLAEQLLLREGVRILYGTLAAAVHCAEDGVIDAVILENKSGRSAIAVGSVVDATGDADVARLAGAPTALFAQGNVLAAWYYRYSQQSGYGLKMLGCCDIPEEQKDGKNGVKLLSSRRYAGVEGAEISELVCASHAVTLSDIRAMRERLGDDYVPVTLPTIPQLRMTRKLVGVCTPDDREPHAFRSDSIGMVSDWRRRGPVFEVPFRSLYAKECPNLLVAGRCVSATDSLWDLMRVIPCCCVTGQAAGTAAALGRDMSALSVPLLQQTLVKSGVVLHWQDL